MNQTEPSKRRGDPLSHLMWLLILASATAIVLFGMLVRSHRASNGVAVDIRLDTNGIATVVGISLGRGPARDVALQALSKGRVPVRVLVPSGGSRAPGWDTNAIQSISAIVKAGLVPTNGPVGSSPYE